ncbi:MAG TPA: hypothetical protein VMM17_02085 [Gemmatimonadaceae bacterium]|nr:hypothetical protein [Gemmatimonadaceae bacterium]
MANVRVGISRWSLTIVSAGLLLFGSHSLLAHAAAVQVPSARPVLRVLFIGNSYTSFNNIGDIVAGIAAADPDAPIIVPVLATRGGATLKWHLENGSAVRQLEAGGWHYVVLQEQSLLGGRIVDGKTIVGDPGAFHASVREWVRRIRAVGATPILYMTWARREPAEAARVQKELADAYQGIGRELDVPVAPVGLAWAEARRRLGTLDLHIWDGSHPTPAGSYLAGLVIYSTLTKRSPLSAPSVIQGRPAVLSSEETVIDSMLRVPLVDLREATAAELRKTAWTVVSHEAR